MKNSIITIIFLSLVCTTFSQTDNSTIHPLNNSWAISGEGGLVIGETDFPDTKLNFTGRGLVEYFLPTNGSSIIGMRLLVGAGYISGKGLSSSSPAYVNIDEFETEFYHAGLGLTYSLSMGELIQPYLNASASYFTFNPLDKNGSELPGNASDTYTANDFNFMGELGLRFLVSEHISLNASYVFNFILDDNIDDIISNDNDDRFHSIFGGVSYYFLSDSDSDEDGVKDSKDLCLNTPKEVEVDEFGCPIDSDGDKIADYLDLCSDTPTNVVVDTNGCPVDLDQDGIVDYLDKCPNSKINVEVDADGCEKIEKIEKSEKIVKLMIEDEGETKASIKTISESTITFLTGKSELMLDQKNLLDKIIESMKEDIDTKWAIIGYADNLGSEDANIKLSLERANKVADYLVNSGIAKSKLQIYGFGTNTPMADNSVEFGRALNRRVEIIEFNKLAERNSLVKTISVNNYDFSEEYSVGNLIFTDGKYFCIQISSWENLDKANEEVDKLISKGHSAFWVEAISQTTRKTRYRVRIGYFETLVGAKEYQKRIR